VSPRESLRVAEILQAGERILEIVRRMRAIDRVEFADQPPDLPEMLDLERSSKRAARSGTPEISDER